MSFPSQNAVLQSAAVATGNGTVMDTMGCSVVLCQIVGITNATITWEVAADNVPTFVAVPAKNINSGVEATTATADGLYSVPVQGATQLRARISAWVAGTITVTGHGITGGVQVVNTTVAAVVGAVDTELPTAAALADATANPTVPGVGAFNEVWNGATWDRMPGTAALGVTCNTELMAAAALADGASATPTTPSVGAVPLLMNATTIDRQRAVVNSLDSNGTGIAAAGIVGQLDDTATSSVTENQFAVARISSRRAQLMEGVVAHDGVNTENPLLAGMEAIAHGTNPTAVAAADKTKWFANRAGVPFVIGGHPNVVTYTQNFTAAQTDTALVTVGSGAKVVVTRVSAKCHNANTVNVSCRIGFGTASVPAYGSAGIVASHPGIPAGGGFVEGNGGAILGVGADNEDLRLTCSVPTSGSIDVTVSYFTIES